MDLEEKKREENTSDCSERNEENQSGQQADAAIKQNTDEPVEQSGDVPAERDPQVSCEQNTKESILQGEEESVGQDVQERRQLPSLEVLKTALATEKRKNRRRKSLRNVILILVVVAAIAILVTTLWIPMLSIKGASMNPLLEQGDLVMTVKTRDLNRGDVIAFYYNKKVLVKRLIGLPGDVIDIDKEGRVSVNGEELQEPYVEELSRKECQIDLPCDVPEGRYFVMGDNRKVSIDSRSREIGCVAAEQIIGKVGIRLWPFGEIGKVQ